MLFLLEIEHNAQTDMPVVLNVGEGKFYVTCRYLPYFCVLVLILVLGLFFFWQQYIAKTTITK